MTGLTLARLRAVLAVFFAALAIPGVVLVITASERLEWETFHQHRVLAEELSSRIDARVGEWLDVEEARPFADYGFLVVAGDADANFVQRSPLSGFPVAGPIPGLIGYFQVDADGTLSTPLLPAEESQARAYGVSAAERDARLTLERSIHAILSENRLVAVRADRPESARKDSAEIAPALDPEASVAETRTEQDRVEAQRAIAGGKAEIAAERIEAPGSSADMERELWSGGRRLLSLPEAPAPSVEEQVPAQAAFDQLESAPARQRAKKQASASVLGRLEDLKLDAPYEKRILAETKRKSQVDERRLTENRAMRKEQSMVPAPASEAVKNLVAPIRTFESEIDPFELSLLDSGHFVLYRKAWRDGRRTIQGALIERRAFVAGLVESAFRDSALARMSNLAVAWQGEVFAAYGGAAGRRYLESASELTGALLYRTRLGAPIGDLELAFTVTRLPAGPGARVITWAALALALVLCGGTLLMYRLGARQIALARQQQDFVSAVSHELKTPLTSIRMYAEMLLEGWASEDKKRGYYAYIHAESERLSRLIANVLQLARMTRNEIDVSPRRVSVGALIDALRSKVSSQVERAGFELRVECAEAAASASVEADEDAFSQILINLVDNALKFSSGADTRAVEIGCRLDGEDRVAFSVRDHGPGIARDQMRKIFGLFYRAENELTRETVGTGIGLALVHRLATAMGAKVDVENANPGARFTVLFPRAPHAP